MSRSESHQLIDTSEWRQHGVNVVPSLVGMAMLALHAYALGVMIAPLEQEFGWSRAEISAGSLVTSVTALLLAAFGGRAVDRYGPRRVALIGVPLYCAALASLALSGPSVLSWLALHVVLAAALVMIYPSVWSAAIVQRFVRNRGLALALVLSGTGIASAVVPFLAATLIEARGWREAYVGLAIIAFVVQFPLLLLFFARSAPAAAAAPLPQPQTASSQGRMGDLFSAKFVRLLIAGLVYTLGATGIAINAVPVLAEEGFATIEAAKIAGLIGIGTISGRVIGGVLLDRIDGRFVAMGCALGAMSAAAIFLLTDQSVAAASIACVLLGFTAGAEFDACAYLISRHFRRDQFATLFSVLAGVFGVISGMSPFIANLIYGLFGSYETLLWGIMPLFVLSGLLFLSLGRYPDRDPELADAAPA